MKMSRRGYITRKQLRKLKNNKILAWIFFVLCCALCFFSGFQLSRVQANADREQLSYDSLANTGSESEQGMHKASHPKAKYYTSIKIQPGDCLYELAEEYISEEYPSIENYISEVKSINHMSCDILYQGCYLILPYYQ